VHPVDAEMEALVLRIVPAAERATWQGATAEQVQQLEELAGRPLPGFYRWFLATMGGAFPHATFGYARQDLRASTVLAAYDEGLVQPDPRLLLIGRLPDPVMPELLFYDLDAPCRDDAMVLTGPESGPPRRRSFETLREKLAWEMLRRHLVASCAQRCEGSLRDDGARASEHLRSVMADLGFTSPILTGAHCALYERRDAALTFIDPIEDSLGTILFFDLGGPDAGALRRLLGEIATRSPLEVGIDRWMPPLPQ
jgi:hypothetical protein